MSGLMDGVRVVDFTQVISGPYCTFMLAQQGADVVKLELPRGGDQARSMMAPEGEFKDAGQSPMFLAFNSGKRSVAVNLKHPEAKDIIADLVKNADVLVENFKAGAIGRLGYDYEWAKAINPSLVYCSISGFGQSGPRAGAAAYDPVIQANSGMMTLTGYDGLTGPTKVGFWVCDMATGMTAAFAVSAALARKRATGEGAYLDISMLDVGASLISPMVTNYLNFGVVPQLMGNGSPASASVSSVYETADGLIQVAAATQAQFDSQMKVMGREDLSADPRFSERENRFANAAHLREELLKTFATDTARNWEKRLGDAGVPAGAVQTIPQMTTDRQIEERGLVRSGPAPTGLEGEVSTVGAPFLVDGQAAERLRKTPNLGEHTDDVLGALGYDDGRIAALRTAGAIG